MANIYNTLAEIKERLKYINNMETLKIGMEKGIGSKDSPFIRIVPEINTVSQNNACLEGGGDDLQVDVIYGFDTKNKDLEELYEQFYIMEEDIRLALNAKGFVTSGICYFVSTLTDQDKLINIKSAIIRFEVLGIR